MESKHVHSPIVKGVPELGSLTIILHIPPCIVARVKQVYDLGVEGVKGEINTNRVTLRVISSPCFLSSRMTLVQV